MHMVNIAQPERHIDVTGIDDHEIPKLRVGTAAGVATSQRGGVTLASRQYALHGRGKTTHSSSQLEHHKNVVNNRPLKLGGTQSITTNDGCTSPLDSQDGPPSLGLRPCTDEEWDTPPTVITTEDMGWDPRHYDQGISNRQAWHGKQPDDSGQPRLFDQSGDCRRRSAADCGEQGPLPSPPKLDRPLSIVANCHRTKSKVKDCGPSHKSFLWQPTDIVRHTFEDTTRFHGAVSTGDTIKGACESPSPAMNVLRRHGPVATDTVCMDCPAIGAGQTAAQALVGRDTHVIDILGVRTDAEFVDTLLDVIRRWGAMGHLISDSAAAGLGTCIKDALHALVIGGRQSEACLRRQDFAGQECQDIKVRADLTLNCSGAPPGAWLLCLKCVTSIMDRAAVESLDHRTPLEVSTGQAPDTSVLLQCSLWGPVCVKRCESQGGGPSPLESNEAKAHFAGCTESVGRSVTYVVVTGDTQQVISRSRLRRIESDSDKGLRMGPAPTSDKDETVKGPSRTEDTSDVAGGLDDGPPVVIKSKRETDKGLDESP